MNLSKMHFQMSSLLAGHVKLLAMLEQSRNAPLVKDISDVVCTMPVLSPSSP